MPGERFARVVTCAMMRDHSQQQGTRHTMTIRKVWSLGRVPQLTENVMTNLLRRTAGIVGADAGAGLPSRASVVSKNAPTMRHKPRVVKKGRAPQEIAPTQYANALPGELRASSSSVPIALLVWRDSIPDRR